jgi:hypothetical protein
LVVSVGDAVRADVDPVDRMTAHRDLALSGTRFIASVWQPRSSGRRFLEVVTTRRLVVEDRNGARRAGAERVLNGCICEAAGGEDWDVLGCVIRRATDLIQTPVEVAVESSYGAVGGDTGCVAGLIDVAGPSGRGSTGTRAGA